MTAPLSETLTATAQRALAGALLGEALTLLGATALVARPAPGAVPRVRPVAVTGRPVTWDAVSIRAALQAFAARAGRAPLRGEWRDARRLGLPGRETVCTVYGSLVAAYRVAGLVLPASRRGRVGGQGNLHAHRTLREYGDTYRVD